jgi:hypothetical protein
MEFACCVCATIALMGVFFVGHNYCQNKRWDSCEAHGGRTVDVSVPESFFTGSHALRCEGLGDDAARRG